MEHTGCAQTNFNNVTCDRKTFGGSIYCRLHAQSLTSSGYELNRGIALDRHMQTRKFDKCDHPDCNRPKTKAFKEKVGQIPFCDQHNVCTGCGSMTTWDFALCWICDGTETKPIEKCVEPGCCRPAPDSRRPGTKLLRCAEHNPCAKCGKKHSWGNFICRKCDPDDRCIEPGCQSRPGVKGKGIVDSSGIYMTPYNHPDLLRCEGHNPCAKCGQKTSYDDLICWVCDTNKK
jgi:hypothetical protein